jgi:hypothetical protein
MLSTRPVQYKADQPVNVASVPQRSPFRNSVTNGSAVRKASSTSGVTETIPGPTGVSSRTAFPGFSGSRGCVIPRDAKYFRSFLLQRTEAWKECNKRLYEYYRTLAPQLPNSFREMEPLFLAVICGC